MKDLSQWGQKDSELSEQSVARMFGLLTLYFIPFPLLILSVAFLRSRLKDLSSLFSQDKEFYVIKKMKLHHKQLF